MDIYELLAQQNYEIVFTRRRGDTVFEQAVKFEEKGLYYVILSQDFGKDITDIPDAELASHTCITRFHVLDFSKELTPDTFIAILRHMYRGFIDGNKNRAENVDVFLYLDRIQSRFDVLYQPKKK